MTNEQILMEIEKLKTEVQSDRRAFVADRVKATAFTDVVGAFESYIEGVMETIMSLNDDDVIIVDESHTIIKMYDLFSPLCSFKDSGSLGSLVLTIRDFNVKALNVKTHRFNEKSFPKYIGGIADLIDKPNVIKLSEIFKL